MTLKHIDFYDSPVMRQLAKQAIDAGKIEKPLIKEASVKTEELKPSGDLFVDLAALANGLRDKGFLAQAENLESKIFQYKIAERAAFDSILEAAHPDGEVEMAPSSKGHGIVETTTTAHEKILEVVGKNPTGKTASEVLANSLLSKAAEALQLKKKADGGVVAPDEENTAKFHQLLSQLKQALFILSNKIVAGGLPGFDDLMVYLRNPPSLGLTSDSKKSVLNDFNVKFSIMNKLLEGSPERESIKLIPSGATDKNGKPIDTSKESFNTALNNVLGLINNVSGFLATISGQKPTELKHKVEIALINKADAQRVAGIFIQAIKYLETWKQIAVPTDIPMADQFINSANNYASILSMVQDGTRYGKIYNALVGLSQSNAGLTTFGALEGAAQSFLAKVKSIISQKLGVKAQENIIEIVKTADELMDKMLQMKQQKEQGQGSAAPANNTQVGLNIPLVPPSGDTKPAQNVSVKPTPKSPSVGTGKKLDTSKPDEVAVGEMQKMLNDVGKGISAGALKDKFGNIWNAKDGQIIGSSGHNSSPQLPDGVWGPQTQKALETAQKYVQALNLSALKMPPAAQWAYGQKQHTDPKVTEEAAKHNSEVLYQLSSQLGTASEKRPGQAKTVFDTLPVPMEFDQYLPDQNFGQSATLPLSDKDLSSLGSFNKWLISSGQRPQLQQDKVGFTVQNWTLFFDWFIKRAKWMYQNAEKNTLENAKAYYQSVWRLYRQFVDFLGVNKVTSDAALIPEDLLSGPSLRRGPGQVPSSAVPSGGGVGQEGQPAGGAKSNKPGEGIDFELPGGQAALEQPPIGEHLDFRTPWWNDLTNEFDVRAFPVLSYTNFNNWPVNNLINSMTTTRTPETPAQANLMALNHMGAYQDRTGTWMTPWKGRTLGFSEAWQDPQYQATFRKQLSLVQSADPTDKARRFLNFLSKTVNDVYGDWVQRANPSPKQATTIDRARQQWQEAIRYKLDQLIRSYK